MKTLCTIVFSLGIVLAGFTQQRAVAPKELRDQAEKMVYPPLESHFLNSAATPYISSGFFTPEEVIVGGTRYDVQSNAGTQNRIYLYDDGTVGVTWTRAMGDPAFADRGSGYNYFDGNDWGAFPTDRIELERTGWPSYSPWGENGEMVVAHGANALVVSTRPQKGTGAWQFTTHPGPAGHEYLIWNRTITSGIDNNRVHTMALTASTVYGGTPYLGQNGALVYSMSTDGGATWALNNEVLPGMSANNYVGFTSDSYTFAEPRDSVVAFVIGDSWYDCFLMKSTDGGTTFSKTLIWEHPYPLFDTENPFPTDTFYCVDGSLSCVIDKFNKVHVVFGINRSYSDGSGTFWFPFVDGIGYWNEDMPAFSSNLNALNPYDHPDSELTEDYNLIGWSQDVDGDGEITLLGEIGTYYIGLSSMVQLVNGVNHELYLIYSSVTETYDNGIANYRHLWARTSPDGGLSWGHFFDLTVSLVHIFDECVYPSCAPYTDDYIYLVYQTDNDPGVNIWGTGHPVTDNNINVMKVLKDDITGVRKPEGSLRDMDVSMNFPNPFSSTTSIRVHLRKAEELRLEVTNLMGQVVYRSSTAALPGLNTLTVDGQHLTSGVYFYTVKTGDSAVTRKMIRQ
ncbi:MAG: T9SS type A sorting domain-containing protein [Bacteroidales bacterium]